MTLRRPRTGQPVSILLVDDNPGDVRLTRKALDDWSVPVQLAVASDGEEALRVLRASDDGHPPPDLILLDLNLPKLDGRELLARVKRDPHLRHIPVIVLTSSTRESDVRTCYGLHASCYLNKPGEFRQLAAMMKAIHDFWLLLVELPGRA